MAYLDDVGGFEEKLFIDYVDTEWCLRARQKGYYLQGVASAHMEHNLGDSYLKVFSKNIPMHSPLRHYYLMRNGIWLMRQPWVGWHWRFLDCIRLFKIFIAFSLFAGEKQQRVKMMLLGVIDAIRGRMGKFED
jgi:rhamnosyltransferase